MGRKRRASSLTNKFIDNLKEDGRLLETVIETQFSTCANCQHLESCVSYLLPSLRETIDIPLLDGDDSKQAERIVNFVNWMEANTTVDERRGHLTGLLDIWGIDTDMILSFLDASFSRCVTYNHLFSSFTDEGYETRVLEDPDETDVGARPPYWRGMYSNLETLDTQEARKLCMAIHNVYDKCGNCRMRMEHASQTIFSILMNLNLVDEEGHLKEEVAEKKKKQTLRYIFNNISPDKSIKFGLNKMLGRV